MTEVLLQQRYSATGVEDASAAMRAVFGVGTVSAGTGPFRYLQRSLVDDGISVSRIVSEGSDVVAQETSSPDLAVLSVRDGALQIVRAGETADLNSGDIGLIPLIEPVELRWQRVTFDVYSFPQSSLRRILGVQHGDVGLRAPRLTPTSSKIAALWSRLAVLVASQVLEDAELYERDQIREQMIDALLGTAIEAFELSNLAEGDPAGDSPTIAAAEAYMMAHVGDPISVPDIARAAGISVRGLQLAFQRELGSAPFLRLRELRLTKAQARLRAAHRSTTTVGAVARGVGYSNLGRFSAHYRDRYGESPAATLREDPDR